MNGFPGDLDSDQSAGLGRGSQIAKNNIRSDRAKFAVDPGKGVAVKDEDNRVKLILEKIQDKRRANRVTPGNEARHQVLARLRAANTLKKKNEENTDSGICSSPNHETKEITIVSSNVSTPSSLTITNKSNPTIPEVINCFSSDEESPPLQNKSSKRKPTNVVLDQFLPPSNPLPLVSDPNSSPRYQSQASGPTSPFNQNSTSLSSFELHNMNSFLKSGSSSGGERPKQGEPPRKQSSNSIPFVNTNMMKKDQSMNDNSFSSLNKQPTNMMKRESMDDRGSHMQQENQPPRENSFRPQNQSSVNMPSIHPNHPLFPVHGFTVPPPPIKHEIPSFNVGPTHVQEVHQNKNNIPSFFRNSSEEPPPQYKQQNKNDIPSFFRNSSSEPFPQYTPQKKNDIPSFFRSGSQEPPPKYAQQNNSSIPSFFQPQNSDYAHNRSSNMEVSRKVPPALPPSLSQYMSKNMNNRHYSQADAIEAVSRLCDYKLPLKNKLSGLKKLMDSHIFNSQLAIQILNADGGNIVQGIRKMIEYYRQKSDDELSRPVLIFSLKVLNKCLDFSANDPTVKSYVNGLTRKMSMEKGEQTSLTFLQQLLRHCDPRGGVFSDEYTKTLEQELLELPEGNILGTTQMSADKPENIVEAFKQYLGITLGVSDSSLVKNVPEQYRIVSLKLENTETGKEIKLAELLLEEDVKNDPRNVWAVNHTTKMSSEKIGNVNTNTTAIVFVALFPTGHFLAYTDTLDNIEAELDEIDRNLNMPPHCVQQVQDLRIGMMVCVKYEKLKERSRRPFRKFKMARALVMEIPENEGRVSVYLIDYGITGLVSIESLSPPPKDLIPIPPRLTFCRLQGVGPAPETGLLRECIRAISRLSTTSSVTTLVSRPTLEAGRILSQLLESGEEAIQMAALWTLATVAGTPLGSKWLVRAKDDMVPCAVELVCPAVVNFLREGRETRSRKNIVICLEILKDLLDQLKPEYMKSVFENTPLLELLYSLKHKKDVMATHEEVIKILCEMQMKGNNFNPDVQINSLRRREIAEKNKRSKYMPGSKPAVPGGELARIVGGQRKEEMQPLIFKNTDIRQREQTPRQESQERLDGPINPYNPHKVVSASGPVWANAGDLSNHQLANQILDDSVQQRNTREVSVSDGKEASRSPPPDPARREEREGSSNRNFTSAAVAEDSAATLTMGGILNFKHGATVELYAPSDKNGICRSHLSTLICGMLNSLRGGSVFIGVKHNGYILGIRLTRQERDHFRQQVDRILASMINPRVPPNTVGIDFHRAEDRTRPALESYVIRIEVSGRSAEGDEKIYMAHNLIAAGVQEGMYLRGPNGNNEKLNQSEIMQELKKQTEKMHSRKIAGLASEMGKLGT